MPIIWRYLSLEYLKISIACIAAFIAILLSIRLDDIAHFATLGAPFFYIFLFTFHQIPYILPIAIPLSCLIASVLLMQRLSSSHELIALRASGFSIKAILSPILFCASFLAILNFWIISEVASESHLKTNLLKNELRSINPLLLLNNKHLMRLKGFHFDVLGPSHVGESASHVILAIPNLKSKRLNLFVAKHLSVNAKALETTDASLIIGFPHDEEGSFDDLFIENTGSARSQVHDFAGLIQRKTLTINNDYLRHGLLTERMNKQGAALKSARENRLPDDHIEQIRKSLNESYSEVLKRLSLALAVFSFSMMGAAFSIQIGRKKSFRSIFYIIALTLLYLIAFFLAKGVDHRIQLTAILYLVPHLVIILLSILYLRRLSLGILV